MGGSPTQPETLYPSLKKEKYFVPNIPVSQGTYDTAGNAVTLTPEQEQIRNAGLSEEAKKGIEFQAAKDSYNKQYEGQQLEQASIAASTPSGGSFDDQTPNFYKRDASKPASQTEESSKVINKELNK